MRVVAMLNMEDFLMIRDLYNQGLNISQIAQKTGFDRKTVRKHLSARTPPSVQPRASKPSKLDDYKDYIQNRITAYPLSAARIHREIRELGFTGKYTIVKDYLREVRPSRSVPAVYRYETKPGVQAQVDWGECGHLDVDGRRRKLYCFSMILGYSRMRYVVFTLSTDVYTLIQCHLDAFEYFGGYTEEVLYDNIKTVILLSAVKFSITQFLPPFKKTRLLSSPWTCPPSS